MVYYTIFSKRYLKYRLACSIYSNLWLTRMAKIVFFNWLYTRCEYNAGESRMIRRCVYRTEAIGAGNFQRAFFLMGYPLETSFDTSGENIQRRELYSMNDFAESEPPGSTNWLLYRSWSALSQGGRLPSMADVLMSDVKVVPIDCQASIIEVGDPNPWNFSFQYHWPAPYPHLGSELCQTKVRDYPCMMHAKSLMSEYFMARESRVPVYHEIEQVLFGISRHYRRIILPMVDAKDQVAGLLVGVRSVRPTYQIEQRVPKALVN